jgi:hypothetical protein
VLLNKLSGKPLVYRLKEKRIAKPKGVESTPQCVKKYVRLGLPSMDMSYRFLMIKKMCKVFTSNFYAGILGDR